MAQQESCGWRVFTGAPRPAVLLLCVLFCPLSAEGFVSTCVAQSVAQRIFLPRAHPALLPHCCRHGPHRWTLPRRLGAAGTTHMSLGRTSTAQEVVEFFGADLRGQTAVITGGTTGLGLETAKALASCGCRVLACALDPQTGVLDIQRSIPEGDVVVLPLDLADLASVERFAARVRREGCNINLLVLNAGICGVSGETQQGFEMQMGVNFLGHALLCRLLLPSLQSGARIVAVSSLGHRFGLLDPSDLNCTYTKFFGWGSYLTSKLALVVWMKALHEQVGPRNIVTLSLSPGVIPTGIWARTPPLLRAAVPLLCDRDAARGAATTVFCCVAPECGSAASAGGSHWSDCTRTQASWTACDQDLRRRLWLASNRALDAALVSSSGSASWPSSAQG